WIALLASLPKGPPPASKRPRYTPQPVSQPAPNVAKSLKPIEAKVPDIWFDDVDETLLDPEDLELLRKNDTKSASGIKKNLDTSQSSEPSEKTGLVKEKGFKGLTKIIAIDCEMVGVGPKGTNSILARVSIVNHFGHCIFDKYVKPMEKVTDYRTAVSGIRKQDLVNGEDFKSVQMEVAKMFQDRIVVGHAIKHDLDVLLLTHPKRMIRDTSMCKPFRAAFNNRTPSLKKLSARMLGVSVQQGEHSSVQDAQATMRLYTMFRKEWEQGLKKPKSGLSTASKTTEKAKIKATTEVAVSIKRMTQYEDSDSE
ncbi:RNA exonuclease 4-like, partial [Tigriopus californicus]|uniref:RNA exonuclease 4-like n=1 Tax=Tigriopus californicus TaxID=6832 RepID=UPI0027DA05B7